MNLKRYYGNEVFEDEDQMYLADEGWYYLASDVDAELVRLRKLIEDIDAAAMEFSQKLINAREAAQS